MPHPADHPLAAAAIVRALSNQLQKAKAAGDEETASAIQAVLDRAQRIVKRGAAHAPPPRLSFPASAEADPEGWAEIVGRPPAAPTTLAISLAARSWLALLQRSQRR